MTSKLDQAAQVGRLFRGFGKPNPMESSHPWRETGASASSTDHANRPGVKVRDTPGPSGAGLAPGIGRWKGRQHSGASPGQTTPEMVTIDRRSAPWPVQAATRGGPVELIRLIPTTRPLSSEESHDGPDSHQRRPGPSDIAGLDPVPRPDGLRPAHHGRARREGPGVEV